jgi:hypothetical protein
MVSLRPVLCQEIRDVMARHLAELESYLPSAAQAVDKIPENLLSCVERLSTICQSAPDEAAPEVYAEACDCYDAFQSFLGSMHQTVDADFKDSLLGEIWVRASQWRQQASRHFQFPLQDVWNVIAPVTPDSLIELGSGQYEARWWKPVPMMDIEILRHTDGVSLDTEPFEPQNFTGGLACRFSLSSNRGHEETG